MTPHDHAGHAHHDPAHAGRSHSHGSHAHGHAPAHFDRAFAVGIGLNAAFVALEAGFGLWSNSVALLADAGHNLSDVLGLVVAWAASALSKRAPTPRFTYGLKASSILAALFNALFLLVAVGAIAWEAVQRFAAPAPVAAAAVMAVAAAGIAVNGFTAWLFAAGRRGDLNIRGAYLHMAADAAVSAAVVVAGLAITVTGWLWLDPVTSLMIVAVIVWSTWGLLRDSLRLSLAAVPDGIAIEDVRGHLAAMPGVTGLHALHVWPISTTETALTAHLVMPDGHPGDDFLMHAAHGLRDRFGIGHVTLQVETGARMDCARALEPVV